MRFRWRSQAHFYPAGDYAHCNDERSEEMQVLWGWEKCLLQSWGAGLGLGGVPERVSVSKKNKVAFYSLA